MKTRDRFPNRHTEECTGCGAWPGEVHEECRGHLGTGIRHHRGARRDLKRRFGRGVLEPLVRRPGARFYVTARIGRRTAYLLGPYISHMTALSRVPRAQQLISERYQGFDAWVSVGTASRADTIPTRLGR